MTGWRIYTLVYIRYWINELSFLECNCNGQAKTCHNRTGKCNCATKGIIGDKCDKCDRYNQYYGDPVRDSCFCKFNFICWEKVSFESF